MLMKKVNRWILNSKKEIFDYGNNYGDCDDDDDDDNGVSETETGSGSAIIIKDDEVNED